MTTNIVIVEIATFIPEIEFFRSEVSVQYYVSRVGTLSRVVINIIVVSVTWCVLFSLNIFPGKGPRRRLHKQDSTTTLMRLIKFYEGPLAKT